MSVCYLISVSIARLQSLQYAGEYGDSQGRRWLLVPFPKVMALGCFLVQHLAGSLWSTL